jgi:hypothetical protein
MVVYPPIQVILWLGEVLFYNTYTFFLLQQLGITMALAYLNHVLLQECRIQQKKKEMRPSAPGNFICSS